MQRKRGVPLPPPLFCPFPRSMSSEKKKNLKSAKKTTTYNRRAAKLQEEILSIIPLFFPCTCTCLPRNAKPFFRQFPHPSILDPRPYWCLRGEKCYNTNPCPRYKKNSDLKTENDNSDDFLLTPLRLETRFFRRITWSKYRTDSTI